MYDFEVKFLLPDKAKALYQPGWYLLNEGEVIDGPFQSEADAWSEAERLEEDEVDE